MSGGRYGFASVNIPCVLFLSILVACGGDREAGAPAGDTGQTPGASASAAAGSSDSAPSVDPDSAGATGVSRPDTGAAAGPRRASAQPTPPKEPPAPRKVATTRPKPAASAPRPAVTEPVGTETPAPAESTPTAPATPEASASPPPEAGAPLRDSYHQAPLDTVSQQVYDGWKQYNLNCARCHGEDVQGTTIAPHLIVSLKPGGPIPTKELFVQTVCAGRPEKGMPAWCPLGLEMAKIEAIHAYVKGRSEGELHLGRPALRQ